LLAIGITALSQLYPSPDQFHLWWVFPLLIVLFMRILGDKGREYLKSNQFHSMSLILITLLLFQLYFDGKQQSYVFKNSSLSGMTSSEQTAPGVDKTMSLLAKIVEPHSLGVICEHGIYAASGMKYLPYNADFFETNGIFNSEKFTGRHFFACNLQGNILKTFLETTGFHVRFSVELSDGTKNVLLERN
jgi:hypothetical protein